MGKVTASSNAQIQKQDHKESENLDTTKGGEKKNKTKRKLQ
jgi:hypothetical protein